MKRILPIIMIVLFTFLEAYAQGGYNAIYSGTPWFDDRGEVVSAHGACIVKDNGRYYLFGEKHTDDNNAFAGFNCYSSTDLYNWKFESLALPVQDKGALGPKSVGERVKVMQCPATKEYVMYMHADSLTYKNQYVGYATARNITGPYTFKGPLLFNGQPIRKWDMGTFQDTDGSGYVLLHGGDIYQLTDDYKSVKAQVHTAMEKGFESPAIFRKGAMYYFLGSNLTSWEKNDNYYYTATSLKGPWEKRGLIAPENTLTWNSQTTFVLPIQGTKGTTYMYMGDRWSYPKQASSATYVWQPLEVSGTVVSIPKFREAWQIDLKTGLAAPLSIKGKVIENEDIKAIHYTGTWKKRIVAKVSETASDTKDDVAGIPFTGTQVSLFGTAAPDGGYAQIDIKNDKGKVVHTALIDYYSKYIFEGLRYVSPVLPKGNYILTVTVKGIRGNWSDKKKNNYGSTGYFVSIDTIKVSE